MPVTPHTITVTVSGVDNSTAVSGAKVYVSNTTKKTKSTEETTNSSGVAIIDLANLPMGDGQTAEYEAGDNIIIVAHYDSKSDAAVYTVAGASHSQSLYLTYVPHMYPENVPAVRLMHMLAANTSAGNLYAKVYDVKTGKVLSWVEVLANSSQSIMYGYKGLGTGGFVVVREANTMVVTVTIQ